MTADIHHYSPMGIFGPGYKQIGDFFSRMIVKLNEDEDNGCKSSEL
jgi:hypothetical protein